jgi:hypothetical protein
MKNMEHSKTGSWCNRGGVLCDNHISTVAPMTLINGEQCMNRFHGLCVEGSCYIPSTAKPQDKQITIKSRREDYKEMRIYRDYAPLIGRTFNVSSEFASDVIIKFGDDLLMICMYDCNVQLRSRRKAIVQNGIFVRRKDRK